MFSCPSHVSLCPSHVLLCSTCPVNQKCYLIDRTGGNTIGHVKDKGEHVKDTRTCEGQAAAKCTCIFMKIGQNGEPELSLEAFFEISHLWNFLMNFTV